MGAFLITSAVVAVLLVATSTLTYETQRGAWRLMRSSRWRHGRMLYALGASFLAHIASIWLYGIAYYVLAHMDGIGELAQVQTVDDIVEETTLLFASYFSAATYTSLGFGDIVPTGTLRMLAGAEALNGLVLIGWTATFSFLAMEEFWEKPTRVDPPRDDS